MKQILLALVLVAGCGYSSIGNEATVQVKRVVNRTPLICPDYVEVDVSLGVMRNGVGSMSKEDLVLALADDAEQGTLHTLREAAENGQLVKIAYNDKRSSVCWPTGRLIAAELESN